MNGLSVKQIVPFGRRAHLAVRHRPRQNPEAAAGMDRADAPVPQHRNRVFNARGDEPP
ncbi:MAG: hypothetical protein O6850_06285 [Acidobacteria bacterium]|nr:hypothetical protein [Acidobacteriota bacterium]